jgi:GH15 family glucan-1,4-alpha-glucosidase
VTVALRIEDYALIGNCVTSALVGRDGSIDWLPLPRFDSPACFAALLGQAQNGRWLIGPAQEDVRTERHYRDDTMILETRFRTPGGSVVLTDFMAMPASRETVHVVRILRGESGSVPMRLEAIFRFDYGKDVPWVRRREDGLTAVVGPDALVLRTTLPLKGRDMTTIADFTLSEGETIPFVLTWYRSHRPAPKAIDAAAALHATEKWWRRWARRAKGSSEWREATTRSLLTLKALTYAPTGGIIAAPTTSLPERLGGVRNWDYRYCWLRDATFTLYALLMSGYRTEAQAWREWLVRAVAGAPAEIQIMYGIAGERRLEEYELPWLAGYEGSAPVRVGNGAYTQFQTDVFGEIMDALYAARSHGVAPQDDARRVQEVLLEHLEGCWARPDSGIWEMRGPELRHTHSAMMAWVAFDRAVKSLERGGLHGPLARWQDLRDRIHAEICERGYDQARGIFVQHYGGKALDAALLRMPLVGFLPPDDPRVERTTAAIARELAVDGFVLRYQAENGSDGLPAGEGAFLLCSFWLADNFALMGREAEARQLFEKLLAIRNDVGLLPEEYDPRARRFLGNFPQAFSHVGLLNTAHNLSPGPGPAHRRARH